MDKLGEGRIPVEDIGILFRQIGQSPTLEEIQVMIADVQSFAKSA